MAYFKRAEFWHRDGEEYPLEVHFVHQAEEGDLAVIGVFMDVGGVHSTVQSIWDAIPGVDQAPTPLVDLDSNAFLPGGRSYFRYAGSLTTPPCSEVVNWVVLTEAIAVSQAQVDAFAALYPINARPVPAALSAVHSDEVAKGRVLPPSSVGDMTLRRYGALSYSQNSARDLRCALNRA